MGLFGPTKKKDVWGRRSKESDREEDEDDDEEYEDDDDEEDEEEEDNNDGYNEEDPEKTCTFQTDYGEFDDEEIYRGESREGWDCDLTQNKVRCRQDKCPLWKNANGVRKTSN